MILVIVSFILVLVLGTFSYAFFNYTRTGSTNNIRVGRINFESSQNNTINLSDVFPTDINNLDNTNSSTVTIGITGDTNYEEGIEYKVSIDQVTNTVNNKEVPISFSVTTSNLGTKSSDYYNERGSTTNVFNLRETGVATNGEDIVIGYIKPDENGVNGSINITAYIDNDSVAISDTVSTIVNDNLVYGETPGDWIAGRTVLTTTEWNSLATNGISFKVKVEANEGLWVEEPEFIVLKGLNGVSDWRTSIRGNITSIEFHNDGLPVDNYVQTLDVTDLTSSGPVTLYTIDDGNNNNTYKAIIVADDVIYAPEDSSTLFAYMSKLETIDSSNFRVDNVTNMSAMFGLCEKITNVDFLANWNTSNVTTMLQLFYGCTSLQNVNGLLKWNTSNVIILTDLFNRCSSLSNVNGLLYWDTSSVTNMVQTFYKCSNLSNINGLVNWNTINTLQMSNMFFDNISLTDFSPLANWNTSNVIGMYSMFATNTGDYNILLDATPFANWDVSSANILSHMFFNRCLQSYLPLKNWDVSSVENFSHMFNGTNASTITTLDGLENWDVSSATNMSSMFQDNSSLVDASAINNWNINSSIDFTKMFNHDNVHPNFTRVQGTWDSEGTFTPTP